jgi:outer membrane protein W
MKKITVVVALLATLFSMKSFAQSDSYTPWQINFTGGYAAGSGKGVKGGVAYAFEPQYHINNNLSVGLRFGAAALLKSGLNTSGDEVGDFSVGAVGNYLATGNYYFQKEGAKFRPFVGLGLGYGRSVGAGTSITLVDIDDESSLGDYGTKGGFSSMIRAGFDISHFRLNLEYDLNPKVGRIKNNYFGVMLGFYIGGGAQKD